MGPHLVRIRTRQAYERAALERAEVEARQAVRDHVQRDRLEFVRTRSTGPGRFSASQLADQLHCSTRTVQRLRREVKDAVDPASRAATRERKQREEARRVEARRAWDREIRAMVGAVEARASSPLSKRRDLNVLRLVAQFVGMLPTAYEFIRNGGSRELLNWDCVGALQRGLDDLIDAYLPAKRDMVIWIYPIAKGRSKAQIRAELDQIANDPTTIAWALHLPDLLRSCHHLHVLSRANSHQEQLHLAQLRRGVGASGYDMNIHYSGAAFMRYLDRNSALASSATGIHFGPAASPEVRVLQGLMALYTRASLGFGRRNLNGVYDVAEYLHWRRANRITPVIPPSWHDFVQRYIDSAYETMMALGTDWAGDLEIPIRLRLAWTELQQLCATPAMPAAPVHLGRAAYYEMVERNREMDNSYERPQRYREEHTRPAQAAAAALPPSLDEFQGAGVTNAAELELLYRARATKPYAACMLEPAIARFIKGNETEGDHEEIHSPFASRRPDFSLRPIEVARCVASFEPAVLDPTIPLSEIVAANQEL